MREENGKKIPCTDDLIKFMKKARKDYFNKQNYKSDRLFIKWLKSLKRSYGVCVDPFKRACLQYYEMLLNEKPIEKEEV